MLGLAAAGMAALLLVACSNGAGVRPSPIDPTPLVCDDTLGVEADLINLVGANWTALNVAEFRAHVSQLQRDLPTDAPAVEKAFLADLQQTERDFAANPYDQRTLNTDAVALSSDAHDMWSSHYCLGVAP